MEDQFCTLELISPTKSHEEQVLWVSVYLANGSFTIAPGHQPLFALLKRPARLAYQTRDGRHEQTQSLDGFVRVWQNRITVVMD